MNESMFGKKFSITGMTLEVVSDEGDKWKLRNVTTNEIILMDKSVLDKSIRLGQAEEIDVAK